VIVFAVIGVGVNLIAAYVTREGDSLNQKAVSLHMLEDVLGWAVLLVGAIVMRFTDLWIIDPLLSLGVAIFILIHTVRNLSEIADLFLMKTPDGVEIHELEEKLLEIDGVKSIHHLRLWSVDGQHHQCSAHLVTEGDPYPMKMQARAILHEHGVTQITLETETELEPCREEENLPIETHTHCHHHHHHHH
jgi:cobalt-zinc-cadmium efflux system protein